MITLIKVLMFWYCFGLFVAVVLLTRNVLLLEKYNKRLEGRIIELEHENDLLKSTYQNSTSTACSHSSQNRYAVLRENFQEPFDKFPEAL